MKDCLYDSCWGRFLMLGHNVTFENCSFVNPRGAVWHVRNGENLVFRNNMIDLTAQDPHGLPYRGSVFVEGMARDVTVSGNVLVGSGAVGLVFDRASAP